MSRPRVPRRHPLRLLHTTCIETAGTTISWHHLWFSNMRMRAFIEEHGLVGHEVALCRKCHGRSNEQGPRQA